MKHRKKRRPGNQHLYLGAYGLIVNIGYCRDHALTIFLKFVKKTLRILYPIPIHDSGFPDRAGFVPENFSLMAMPAFLRFEKPTSSGSPRQCISGSACTFTS